MDYSNDACYTQFTAGQDARADFMMATYRPQIGSNPAKQSAADQPVALAVREASMQVSPNPFNPTTTIEFAVPRTGSVTLRVVDVAGREVARLVDGTRDAGTHHAVFHAAGVPSGIYMAILQTLDGTTSKRLVLLK